MFAMMAEKLKTNWVTVLVPFLIMWGSWMTLNVATMSTSKDMDKVLHMRISKTEAKVTATFQREIDKLRGEINDRDTEITRLRSTLIMFINTVFTMKLDNSR